MQLQFGGTAGAAAVGGVSVGVGQPTVAQALQMTAGSGSTLESHPALTALSQEVRVESGGWKDAKEGGGGQGWENESTGMGRRGDGVGGGGKKGQRGGGSERKGE